MFQELDRHRLEGVIEAMAEHLEGDWLLIGGALVALWLEPRRVTEDMDIIGLTGTQEERFRLMQFAEGAGLPIEAVNTAADFFVRRIAGWRDEIELFRSGRRARIYRPTPTLFLLLKMGRLSEQDLADCLALINKTHSDGLPLDRERVLAAIEALSPAEDRAILARRNLLREALTRPTS